MAKVKIDNKKIAKEYTEKFLEVIDDVILDYLCFEENIKMKKGIDVLNNLTTQDYIEILETLLEEVKKSS